MKFRIVLGGSAALALAACGSADDASTEAEADSVEIPANEALEGVEAEPVMDEEATMEDTSAEEAAAAAAAEVEQIEEAGDNAAETAGAALDALEEAEAE